MARPGTLIVFTRYPEPGAVKTRLIPALGAEGAAELQRGLTEQAVARARAVAAFGRIAVEVRFDGGAEEAFRQWLGPGLRYLPQGPGDIGVRMKNALAAALARGEEKAVLVGSDIPQLTPEILLAAFQCLDRRGLALGPARDGGYYLIGLSRRARLSLAGLFDDVPWSTGQVLATTIERGRGRGLAIELLETLDDLDLPGDLERYQPDPSLTSVIIPALNEAETIAAAIAGLHPGGDAEVIVCDGGSSDDTAALARKAGATVISSPPGRARQMNAGAAAAQGDAFVFLHADTALPAGFDLMARAALTLPEVAAGAFELALDDPRPWFRLIETMANFRSRALGLPYGDQALFMTKRMFEKIGGFPDLPVMEDFEMARRLRRVGRVLIMSPAALSSARRWRRTGLLATTLMNQAIVAGYHAGISPQTISRWRQRKRG